MFFMLFIVHLYHFMLCRYGCHLSVKGNFIIRRI